MSGEHSPNIFLAAVRSQGRITIPQGTRDYLGIEEGDIVIVEIRRVVKARGEAHESHA